MIFKLQRRTDLALLALRRLAEAGEERLAGAELAEALGTTATFLPQVMSPLIRAGWVVSERGPGGGYRLTGQAETVSLLDVIEATEGPTTDGRCAMRDAPCPGDHACPVHAVATEARAVLADGFREIPAVPNRKGAIHA